MDLAKNIILSDLKNMRIRDGIQKSFIKKQYNSDKLIKIAMIKYNQILDSKGQ